MLSLAKNQWRKAEPISRTPVEVVESALVRLAVYRDELPTPWDTFLQAPLRSVLGLCPPLTVCDKVSCDCPAFHKLTHVGEPDQQPELTRRKSTMLCCESHSCLRVACRPFPGSKVCTLSRGETRFGILLRGFQWSACHVLATVKPCSFGPQARHPVLFVWLHQCLSHWPLATWAATSGHQQGLVRWNAHAVQPVPGAASGGQWWAVHFDQGPSSNVMPSQVGDILIVQLVVQVPVIASRPAATSDGASSVVCLRL